MKNETRLTIELFAGIACIMIGFIIGTNGALSYVLTHCRMDDKGMLLCNSNIEYAPFVPETSIDIIRDL